MSEIREQIGEGIVRITLDSLRWYYFEERDTYKPSTTWITDYVPKDKGFYMWLANKVKSWEDSQQKLKEGGERGSAVHWAIERFSANMPVHHDEVPPGRDNPLTLEEYEHILAAANFFNEYKPIVLSREFVIEGDDYAGTCDFMGLIDNEEWIIDWKTSGAIYPSHIAQLAAYWKTFDNPKLRAGIVRTRSRHKARFEFKEITDLDWQYKVFRAAKTFWDNDNKEIAPNFVDVPEKVQLNYGEENAESKLHAQDKQGHAWENNNGKQKQEAKRKTAQSKLF